MEVSLGGVDVLMACELAHGVNISAAAERIGAEGGAGIVPAVIYADRLFNRFPRRRGNVLDGARHAGSVAAEEDEIYVAARLDPVFLPVFRGKVRVFLQDVPKVIAGLPALDQSLVRHVVDMDEAPGVGLGLVGRKSDDALRFVILPLSDLRAFPRPHAGLDAQNISQPRMGVEMIVKGFEIFLRDVIGNRRRGAPGPSGDRTPWF